MRHKLLILTNLPVEGTGHNQHMHRMRIQKDLVWPHKHKHHSLVHIHSMLTTGLDQLADPSYQMHPTIKSAVKLSICARV